MKPRAKNPLRIRKGSIEALTKLLDWPPTGKTPSEIFDLGLRRGVISIEQAESFREKASKNTMTMDTPILTGPSMKRHKSKQDYETPDVFMKAVVRRFGPIVWDLAASAGNTKHPNYFSIEQDSFKQAWHKIPGNLWLNPEFDDIGPWAEKCAAESALGANILFLTPASIGSNWFARFVHPWAFVLGLNGRISFDGVGPYPKDCMLSCFNPGSRGFDVWRWRDDP